jgi:hypothetical protein
MNMEKYIGESDYELYKKAGLNVKKRTEWVNTGMTEEFGQHYEKDIVFKVVENADYKRFMATKRMSNKDKLKTLVEKRLDRRTWTRNRAEREELKDQIIKKIDMMNDSDINQLAGDLGLGEGVGITSSFIRTNTLASINKKIDEIDSQLKKPERNQSSGREVLQDCRQQVQGQNTRAQNVSEAIRATRMPTVSPGYPEAVKPRNSPK